LSRVKLSATVSAVHCS